MPRRPSPCADQDDLRSAGGKSAAEVEKGSSSSSSQTKEMGILSNNIPMEMEMAGQR